MSTDLVSILNRHLDAGGGDGDGPVATAIEGLYLMRAHGPTLPVPHVYQPALCVVVQGAKRVLVGETAFDYRAGQALVISLDLPVIGRVTQASSERPFLGFNLDLDTGVLREVVTALGTPPTPAAEASGVSVGELDASLADAMLRLLRLLDTPAAIPVLLPGLLREIGYWLLTGPHADVAYRLALPNGPTRRIAEAIRLLRADIAHPVRVGQLADAANMSPSSFHHHFKLLTTMTPVQYQKQLRLLEARRLMLAGEANASAAAYRVGYESASQFSREYARMFGAPPRRDVAEARATVGA